MTGQSAASRLQPSRLRLGRRVPNLYAWATILPVLILVAAFTLYPFAFATAMSVRKYILTQPNSQPFIGLRNFSQVIGDELFAASATNTLIFTLLSVPLVTLLGLGVALLLNHPLRGFGILRALVLFIKSETNGAGVDAAIDAVGTVSTRRECIDAVARGRRVVFIGLHAEESEIQSNLVIRSEITIQGSFAYTPLDFEAGLNWFITGHLKIDPWLLKAPLTEGRACFERLLSKPGPVAKILLYS